MPSDQRDREVAVPQPVEHGHLEPDEDQHDAEPVLQEVELVDRPGEQEVEVPQAEDREDVRGEHDERLAGEAEDRGTESTTMDSETLVPPIPRDDPGGYLLKNVLYTQYFSSDGSSIHYNYWLVTFGYPGSHGCLGINLDDSKFFWDWAGIGTPIVIR